MGSCATGFGGSMLTSGSASRMANMIFFNMERSPFNQSKGFVTKTTEAVRVWHPYLGFFLTLEQVQVFSFVCCHSGVLILARVHSYCLDFEYHASRGIPRCPQTNFALPAGTQATIYGVAPSLKFPAFTAGLSIWGGEETPTPGSTNIMDSRRCSTNNWRTRPSGKVIGAPFGSGLISTLSSSALTWSYTSPNSPQRAARSWKPGFVWRRFAPPSPSLPVPQIVTFS